MPSLSWGFLYDFSVVGATVTQLDADSYRLRIEVDWWTEDVPLVYPSGYDATPGLGHFTNFGLERLGTAYNYYGTLGNDEVFDYNPGPYWSSVGYAHGPGTLGHYFGYDFDYNGPLPGNFSLAYSGQFQWNSYVVSPYGEQYGNWLGQENFGGTFNIDYAPSLNQAATIPEPLTIVLMSAGLVGLGIVRRKK